MGAAASRDDGALTLGCWHAGWSALGSRRLHKSAGCTRAPRTSDAAATSTFVAGEDLQFKLERITEVGRAYVHLDYEHTHTPERG